MGLAVLGLGSWLGCGGVSRDPLRHTTGVGGAAGSTRGGNAGLAPGASGDGVSAATAGEGGDGGPSIDTTGDAGAPPVRGGASGTGGSGAAGDHGGADARAGAPGSDDGGSHAGLSGGGSAGLSGGGSAGLSEGGSAGEPRSPGVIAPPLNYLPYCSMRGPGGPEFEFSWEADPCENIMLRTGWSEDGIARAGMFDPEARSSVIMQCAGDGVTGTWVYFSPAIQALQAAKGAAHADMACTFTVAPHSLPVFSAPFSLDPLPAGFQMSNSGYDFAALPGSVPSDDITATLNITLYTETAHDPSSCDPPSPGCSTAVSYRGQDRSDSRDNDQQGFTWAMDAGAPVLAMAPGEVIAKRARPVTGCYTEVQNELYVRHVVGPSLDSRYSEIFIAYYAHLDFDEDIEIGSVVERGDVLGSVGTSGCTAGQSQLHLAVLRGSNSAREYRPVLDTTPGTYGASGVNPDNSVARIDPWGWMAKQNQANIDPGGYVWYHRELPGMGPNGGSRLGGGALSIALFNDGQAPPRPCDEDERDWVVEGGGTIRNPFAHCSL